jgi:hypothetical protein
MVKRKQMATDFRRDAETIVIRDDGVLVTHTGAPFRGLRFDGIEYDVISYEDTGFMFRVDTEEDMRECLRRHKFAMWRTRRPCRFSADAVIAQAMQPRPDHAEIAASVKETYGYAAHISDH